MAYREVKIVGSHAIWLGRWIEGRGCNAANLRHEAAGVRLIWCIR